MKLSSQPKGEFSGKFRLQFSAKTPGEWNTATQFWTLPPLTETFVITAQNNDGVCAKFDLGLHAEAPGEIYIYGGASLEFSGQGFAYNGPIGGGGGIFIPGKPVAGKRTGSRQTGTQNLFQGSAPFVVEYDIGFEMPMPWNGKSAKYTGHWWAKWTVK